MVRTIVIALLTWAGAACGGSQGESGNTTVTVEPYDETEAGGPSAQDSAAQVARMGELFAALGNGVDAAGADCDKVAASIRGWTQTNAAEVRALNGKLAAMPKAHVDALAPSLEAKLRKAALQIKDGTDRCPDHRGVFEAKSGLNL